MCVRGRQDGRTQLVLLGVADKWISLEFSLSPGPRRRTACCSCSCPLGGASAPRLIVPRTLEKNGKLPIETTREYTVLLLLVHGVVRSFSFSVSSSSFVLFNAGRRDLAKPTVTRIDRSSAEMNKVARHGVHDSYTMMLTRVNFLCTKRTTYALVTATSNATEIQTEDGMEKRTSGNTCKKKHVFTQGSERKQKKNG